MILTTLIGNIDDIDNIFNIGNIIIGNIDDIANIKYIVNIWQLFQRANKYIYWQYQYIDQ